MQPTAVDFRAAALWALDLTLFMSRKIQNDREFLTAGRTQVLVMRRGALLRPRTIRGIATANVGRSPTPWSRATFQDLLKSFYLG